jgi:hypothetical protein
MIGVIFLCRIHILASITILARCFLLEDDCFVVEGHPDILMKRGLISNCHRFQSSAFSVIDIFLFVYGVKWMFYFEGVLFGIDAWEYMIIHQRFIISLNSMLF